MTEKERYFLDAIREAARMGAAVAISQMQPDGDLISQREASRIFGAEFVHGCIAEGLVGYVRNSKAANAKKWLSRAALSEAHASRSIELIKVKLKLNAKSKSK